MNDQTLDGTVSGGTLPTGTTPRGTSAWSIAVTPPPGAPYAQGEELVGTLLAERYEILELLGQGGMGAVYKARDTELERLVALKLIRADLASNPEILRRFKQELILAREVTHRNVIRIFDLGQAKGFKFITMEFVEGRDLRVVLRERGKLPPDETVRIIAQVCRALESAHAAGVVHRDLKPQNIMLDAKDRVYVMDFGIAHSLETPGMTQTGALMGTPEYMSPEQAKGIKVDARSDLFALGIIFYEMLTGISPYKADTALATLLKRTQERPPPLVEVDPTIPKAISDVVMKCLEIDRDQRYSTAREILEDLGHEMPTSVRAVAPTRPPTAAAPKPTEVSLFQRYQIWIAGAAAVVLLAALGIVFRGKIFSGSAAKRGASVEQASLAILPFRNASGDSSLDWLGPSLADMLSTDVGQSARLRSISPDRLHQVLSDLRITPGTAIDPTMVGRIAEFSSADTVVWGQYAKFGEQIRIDATLLDLKHNRRAPLKIEAASEKEIPGTVDGLAELIRKNLAVSPDVLKELKASSFQPTSQSVPALRAYNQGSELLREGKNLDALKYFQNSTKDDAEFALAFSKMADAYSRLGYDTEAEQSASKAVELSENLPTAEKYLIAANHFRIAKDYPKAIEAYQNLAKVSPDNSDIESALGAIYENSGDFAKAREFYQKLLAANPKDIVTLLAIGRVEIQSGNPQASLDPLNRALSLAIQVDNQEQKGTILHVLGAAYFYLNKPEDALQNYKQALEIRRSLGEKKGIADGLTMIAETYAGLGKSDLALKNYNNALQIYREIGDQQDAGDILGNLGQYYDDRGKYDEALKLFKEALQIHRDLRNQDKNSEALWLNNIGNTYLFKGDYDDARIYFEQALQLREKINVPSDIASTVHNLAEVNTKSGQYEQALSQYMRALELYRNAGDKHGTAVEAYSMGTIFEYQGRYGSAESSKKQALQNFREVKENSFWMGEALSGYGNALSEAGQFDEGSKTLEEALGFSRQLKNDALVAQALNWQGDNFLYRGDRRSAKSSYDQALQTASKTTDRHLLLVSRLNSAKITIEEGQPQGAMRTLKGVADEAEALGLKYLSIECSIHEAEGRMQLKDYSAARQQLERAVLQSEKLGLRPLLLRAHFSLGKMFREKGAPADATSHYRQALSLLDSLRKEPGADKIIERSDFKAIYAESDRWLREHR
ncbi:MAG TPA: tetratricopeptide repeat protein [Candidatus Acidoferrum sp.]|nr:tetratricopeptide repeat protein [Candidatus Acidoferrum sp.]